MSDLGGRLKQARVARGVSLRDIATATKISVVALEALERNDYGRLPGGIFGRSFVRAYAVAVGLEPDGTVEEFVSEFERYEREAERNAIRREITPDDRAFLERQRRAIRILRIILVVAGAAIVGAFVYLMWLRPA
jgi:cytoskeletal protein RodZ